jgi:tRNA modification GTPase
VVVNKVDAAPSPPSLPKSAVAVSALTGEGIDGLEARLEAVVGGGDDVAGTLLWTQRQGAAAARAAIQLKEARAELARGEYGPAATEIGDALRSLDELLGIDPSEAVLDELFARFCVGK